MNGSMSSTFSPPGSTVSSGIDSTPAKASNDRRLTAPRPMAMKVTTMITAPIHGPRDSGATKPPASSRAPRARCSGLRT
ncbi:hypothetical protein D3C75_1267510 [compost metagenome]